MLESRLNANQQQALKRFCEEHGVTKLAFFGSILTEGFKDESDVDIMVEFALGRTPGYAFFGLADELEAILGRKVDLTTYGGLHPFIKDDVLRSAELYYLSSVI